MQTVPTSNLSDLDNQDLNIILELFSAETKRQQISQSHTQPIEPTVLVYGKAGNC